ncbi:hypothetical protein AAMO2058_001668000 [Amorphochlora amoebiformis]
MDPDESLPLPSGRIILGRGRPAPNWPEEKKPSFRPQDSGHSWSRIESKSRSERPRITSIPKGTSQWTKSLDTKALDENRGHLTTCPICGSSMPKFKMRAHVNSCLDRQETQVVKTVPLMSRIERVRPLRSTYTPPHRRWQTEARRDTRGTWHRDSEDRGSRGYRQGRRPRRDYRDYPRIKEKGSIGSRIRRIGQLNFDASLVRRPVRQVSSGKPKNGDCAERGRIGLDQNGRGFWEGEFGPKDREKFLLLLDKQAEEASDIDSDEGNLPKLRPILTITKGNRQAQDQNNRGKKNNNSETKLSDTAFPAQNPREARLFALIADNDMRGIEVFLRANGGKDNSDMEHADTGWVGGMKAGLALHVASKLGRLALLQMLIHRHNFSVYAKDPRRRSALHIACLYDRPACTQLLIEAKAQANIKDASGDRPIHCAAVSNADQCIHLLLSIGALSESRNKKGLTPLHVACANGGEKAVRRLLAASRQRQAQRSKSKRAQARALHVATAHPSIVRILLQSKADYKAQDANRLTPLSVACRKGHVASATLLINAKADLNHSRGSSEHTGGICFSHLPLHDVSVAPPDASQAILVKILIRHKAEVNLRATSGDRSSGIFCGDTPLRSAVRTIGKRRAQGDVNLTETEEAIRCLLEMKAGIGLRGGFTRNTPLHIASSFGDTETLKILLEEGVSGDDEAVNSLNRSNETPLLLAIKKASLPCARLLVKYGAKMDSRCSGLCLVRMKALLRSWTAAADVPKAPVCKMPYTLFAAIDNKIPDEYNIRIADEFPLSAIMPLMPPDLQVDITYMSTKEFLPNGVASFARFSKADGLADIRQSPTDLQRYLTDFQRFLTDLQRSLTDLQRSLTDLQRARVGDLLEVVGDLLEAMIYLYTNYPPRLSPSAPISFYVELVVLANFLDLPKLKETAERMIIAEKLNFSNAKMLLTIADLHQASLLSKFCVLTTLNQSSSQDYFDMDTIRDPPGGGTLPPPQRWPEGGGLRNLYQGVMEEGGGETGKVRVYFSVEGEAKNKFYTTKLHSGVIATHWGRWRRNRGKHMVIHGRKEEIWAFLELIRFEEKQGKVNVNRVLSLLLLLREAPFFIGESLGEGLEAKRQDLGATGIGLARALEVLLGECYVNQYTVLRILSCIDHEKCPYLHQAACKYVVSNLSTISSILEGSQGSGLGTGIKADKEDPLESLQVVKQLPVGENLWSIQLKNPGIRALYSTDICMVGSRRTLSKWGRCSHIRAADSTVRRVSSVRER